MRLIFFSVIAISIVNAQDAHTIVTCNHEHPGEVHLPGENLLKTIGPILDGPGLALCNEIPYANSSEILYHESPHYTFQIDRRLHTDTFENCRAAFEAIVTECVSKEQVLGGDAYLNDIGYEIYHTELRERDIRGDPELGDWMRNVQASGTAEIEDGSGDERKELERRDILENDYEIQERDEIEHHITEFAMRVERKSARKRPVKSSQKKPTKKPSKKPAKPSAKKPAKHPAKKPGKSPAKKPAKEPAKKPATKTQKSCPTAQSDKPRRKTKTGKNQPRTPAGRVSNSKKQPTGDGSACQPEDTLDCKKILAEVKAKNARENANDKLLGRDLDSEPRDYVQDFIHSLTKRTSKPGSACGESFNARTYPNPNARVLRGAPVFGWAHPQQCQRMEWGSTHTFQKVPRNLGGEYEVEHILEWQLVTSFFRWLDRDHFQGKDSFTDPEKANKGAKVDFCTYWKKTWNVPAFKIPVNGNRAHNAKQHVARQFPGVDFQDEFVWLQADINAPAKQQMWAFKDTDQIYDVDKAVKDINRGATDAAVQAIRAKALLGAQIYHKNPIVKQFLIDQKKRIGVALDEIDQALPNSPPSAGHTAWQHQGLLNLWNTYMDEAFRNAKLRTDNTMDKMVDALESKWVIRAARNDALGRWIKAVRTEWRKEKRSGWHQPSW